MSGDSMMNSSNPDIDAYFQWREMSEEYGGRTDRWTEMRALLTCGCWSPWVHNASSTWDFPNEEQVCATHGEKQFHVMVQAMLNDSDSEIWG